MAVPRCNWKRSIAAITSSRLSVGACTTAAVPANDTTPTRTVRGRSVTKVLAASCAATMRLGCTSVARMLPDTSIARMMVSCCDGSVITAVGRDAANSSAASASSSSAGGTMAAPARALAERLLDQREAGVAHRASLAPVQQPQVQQHQQRRQQQQRPQQLGQRKVMMRFSRDRRPPRRADVPACARRLRWRARWRRKSAKRSIASSRSSSVASSSVSTPACASASRNVGLALRGQRLEALAKAGSCGVDEQLLAGLGVVASSPGRGRAAPSRAGRTGAPRSPRGAAPAGASASSQPGALMKSETTNTVERRVISVSAGVQQIGQHVWRGGARRGASGAAGGGACACAAAGSAHACGRRAAAARCRRAWP